MPDVTNCELCGLPMPPNETMFKFHGYSGPCPAPLKPSRPLISERERFEEWARNEGYYVFDSPINDEHPHYYTEENVRCMWSAWEARAAAREGKE